MSEMGNYRGNVLRLIRESGASIGDVIEVRRGREVYRGTLISRTQGGRENYVVLKLRSGYNIGVKINDETRFRLVERGSKPAFRRYPLPKARKSLPSVHIFSTGGTIASRIDYRTGGVEPALNSEDLYSIIPELSEIANIKAHILFNEFSENLNSTHWRRMSEAVRDAVEGGADGVVICHGTDTLGYTAAALSFSLSHLPMPVVLVGSQRSSDRPSSDAASNLIGAVDIAARAPFAEVVVVMHESTSDDRLLVHRGTKVRKCHTSARNAFKSINVNPLAIYNVSERKLEYVQEGFKKRNSSSEFSIETAFDENVILIKYYPAMKSSIIYHSIEKGVRGIILEGTGLGHVGRQMYEAIEKAVEEGIFVGMTSQCLWGKVNLNIYYTGRDLLSIGVTPLEDMLPETALVKLMWILGRTRDVERVRELMTLNLAGEIAERRWLHGCEAR